jgi:hypothetical protein
MTVQITLPKEIEQRLQAEVTAGRHASIEEVILERLSRNDQPDLLESMSEEPTQLRADLNRAWMDRDGAIDGEQFFADLAYRSGSDR